jgi:cell division protein FtsB
MAEDLTKKLNGLLADLKQLMANRRERILQLQAEIAQIEKENTDLQAAIETMLKDF